MKIKYLLLICFVPKIFNGQGSDIPVFKPAKQSGNQTELTGFRLCIDIKLGSGTGFINAQRFHDEHNTVGSHGSIYPPEVSINRKNENQSSPFFNLGLVTRFNPFFELQANASFIQSKYDLNYYDYSEKYTPSSLISARSLTNANGTLISNSCSFGIAPTIRVFNTKIIFGILNIVSSSYKTSLSGIKSDYQVTRKAYWPSYSYQTDSIVLLVNQEMVQPTKVIGSNIYLPFSIGIEQEIPIKSLRYLIGVKCIGSFRSYSPFMIFGYFGIRLSKPYSWRED
jgi:hypothetical protein